MRAARRFEAFRDPCLDPCDGLDGRVLGERGELGVDLVSHDFRRSLASFLIIAARADEGAVTGVMGHSNIATTRRLYAADWREAEERNEIILRQLADAGIGQ